MLGYKEKFIDSIKSIYADEFKKKQAIESAEQLIHNYFSSIEEGLKEYSAVANVKLDFRKEQNNYTIKFDKRTLIVSSKGDLINVKALPYMGTAYEDTVSLSDKDFKFVSKDHNLELSIDLLDMYLREAFEKALVSN